MTEGLKDHYNIAKDKFHLALKLLGLKMTKS